MAPLWVAWQRGGLATSSPQSSSSRPLSGPQQGQGSPELQGPEGPGLCVPPSYGSGTLPGALGGLESHPMPCPSSEEPPLDLTGKVYQLEVMLKQLHTDLQKVRPPGSQPSARRWAVWLPTPSAVAGSKADAPVHYPPPCPLLGRPPSFECSQEERVESDNTKVW